MGEFKKDVSGNIKTDTNGNPIKNDFYRYVDKSDTIGQNSRYMKRSFVENNYANVANLKSMLSAIDVNTDFTNHDDLVADFSQKYTTISDRDSQYILKKTSEDSIKNAVKNANDQCKNEKDTAFDEWKKSYTLSADIPDQYIERSKIKEAKNKEELIGDLRKDFTHISLVDHDTIIDNSYIPKDDPNIINNFNKIRNEEINKCTAEKSQNYHPKFNGDIPLIYNNTDVNKNKSEYVPRSWIEGVDKIYEPKEILDNIKKDSDKLTWLKDGEQMSRLNIDPTTYIKRSLVLDNSNYITKRKYDQDFDQSNPQSKIGKILKNYTLNSDISSGKVGACPNGVYPPASTYILKTDLEDDTTEWMKKEKHNKLLDNKNKELTKCRADYAKLENSTKSVVYEEIKLKRMMTENIFQLKK